MVERRHQQHGHRNMGLAGTGDEPAAAIFSRSGLGVLITRQREFLTACERPDFFARMAPFANPSSRCMAKRFLSTLISLVLFGLLVAPAADFKRTEDVIYHRKFGTALTMDVFQPSRPNGLGIAFMVSGGWFSAHESVNTTFYKPFLDHGYTVFAVVHGSQPKF